ncbi:MAG TPA: hypothetical protein VM077_00465 [Candidatus Limnocylindrales bacterium]|nr:hypothetical protein [Candidatus Limnocylindrales bacterium]
MINNKNKFVKAAIGSVIILSTFVTAAFATTSVSVVGNGAFSNSDVSVRNNKNTSLQQSNNAFFSNSVNANTNTGGNKANKNTGGSTVVVTGDANTSVDIKNKANKNVVNHGGMNHGNGNADMVDGRGRTRTTTTGFTDGWFDGKTVKFFYSKFKFFCKEPPTSGADSNCEAGAEPQSKPRGGDIPKLYVMTPLGFRPAENTLQCPTVGNCINHPMTIDVSRVLGAGTENLPLPAHSHIVDEDTNGWWELEVVGVKDQATWDKVVAGKSLDTVRALQADTANADKITGDIPTNSFLFFDVLDN